MRVVVDTNVFVSLLIRPGEAFTALIDYIDRNATVLYSTETLTELVDVLRRPKFDRYMTGKGRLNHQRRRGPFGAPTDRRRADRYAGRFSCGR
ncbi:MAG TPA: putative toxin-antitoxin system toxin component, PIN family [Alphaproteobacteria bacterium]|nr:putative toxin-antitoxin system toxin component, PIN family [Alphaproteobacteria bacterium]